MRFTVGKKIGFGFGVVVILLLIVFSITYSVVSNAKQTLEKSIESNDKFLTVDQPSLFEINHLKDNLSETHNYMQKWCNDQSRSDEQYKLKAIYLLDKSLKNDLLTLDTISKKWSSTQIGKTTYDLITKSIFELIDMYNFSIREQLVDFESYDDQTATFISKSALDKSQSSISSKSIPSSSKSQLRYALYLASIYFGLSLSTFIINLLA